MAQPPGHGLLVIERILRDRDGVWRQIIEQRSLGQLTRQMLASSVLCLAVYGAVLGASYGWQQALSSTIKLPLLFLATLAICLPTLYLFNLVFGARLSVIQAVSLIMVSIAVTSALTLAFAPISLFFLITAQSYSFYKLLNVGILLLTALVGLRFLTAGMRALNEHQESVRAEQARQEALAAQAARIAASPIPAVPAQAAPGAAVPAPAQEVPIAVPAGATPPNGAPTPNGATPAPAPAATPVPGTVPDPGPVPARVGVPVHGPAPVLAADGVTVMTAVAPYPYPQPVPGGRPVPAGARRPAPERPASMSLLYIWMLLFGFVGTQLAWTLRPFFGSRGEPFGLFRHIGGTFYGDVISTLGRLLGG